MCNVMKFSPREIAAACSGELYINGEDRSDSYVTSVVLDSRKVEAGSVFVATIGEHTDGHRFVSTVFKQGAILAVVSKTPEQVQQETGEDCSSWGSYILVEDTLQALKSIAECYRKKVAIPIVGITGSVGKTSTKEFVAGVLEEKFNVLKTEGNFNNEIGVPLTLLRIRPGHEVAVVEMGISDFGEMHRLSKMVRPNVCVITNIGQCHLENLKSREGILKAKSEIFDFMADDGEICLNGEDDMLCALQEVKGHKPHFFGLGGNSEQEVWAEIIESHGLWGSDAAIHWKQAEGTGSKAVQVPLPGKHMVLNAAAAACVAKLFGLREEKIVDGIGKIAPVSGRNHLIRLKNYTLIDDCYNANPASMRAAIDLLQMADTEKIAILGDMFELGEDSDALHAGVGEYAATAGIDRIICVGENSTHMYEAAIMAAAGNTHIAHFPDRDSLLNCLRKEREEYIPNGSTVLIKASHGMEFTKILDSLKGA